MGAGGDGPAPTRHACLSRVVADSSDRVNWLRARTRGITATDVAKLSTPRSIEAAAEAKLHGSGFAGNPYTEYGRQREPVIAAWVQERFVIEPSSLLFHAASEVRHLATPDGIALRADGAVELAEIKTTNKAWRTIPKHYLRQVWWQQYVIGAQRTLFVWEEHRDFRPLRREPQHVWIDRDDAAIADLISNANRLIDRLHEKTQASRERAAQRADYGPAALHY
ncbi:YqaJ viral recombinase family protein [Zhihengliuella flava]|uniref:YqaJ viral recombinase family protein n=1 Tax=Zhihengliuella flava TaxID=1285193 RepID=UPI0018C95E5B